MPAKSQQQQKIMGLALAYKRGEVPASKVSAKVKEMAKTMTEKELEKYASAKHKGLPRKVVKESSLSTFEQFIREKDEEEIESEPEDITQDILYFFITSSNSLVFETTMLFIPLICRYFKMF